jgi:hypothetical protein
LHAEDRADTLRGKAFSRSNRSPDAGPKERTMKNIPRTMMIAALAIGAGWLPSGCGSLNASSNAGDNGPPVTTVVTGANVVSTWNEVATATINQPSNPNGTAEEQRPIYGVDLATVHVAMYDAVIAIAGTHRPFIVTPTVPTAGASHPRRHAFPLSHRGWRRAGPKRRAMDLVAALSATLR